MEVAVAADGRAWPAVAGPLPVVQSLARAGRQGVRRHRLGQARRPAAGCRAPSAPRSSWAPWDLGASGSSTISARLLVPPGWFRPGKRRRNISTFAGLARRDVAVLGESWRGEAKGHDETPLVLLLAGSVVNKLTSMAAARRRSTMLRPMDESRGPNCHASKTGAVTPGADQAMHLILREVEEPTASPTRSPRSPSNCRSGSSNATVSGELSARRPRVRGGCQLVPRIARQAPVRLPFEQFRPALPVRHAHAPGECRHRGLPPPDSGISWPPPLCTSHWETH